MKKLFPFILFIFAGIASFAQSRDRNTRPLIGISCSYPDSAFSSVRRTYTQSVLNAGGLPLLIPVIEEEKALSEILNHLDALILTGGEDIHPSYYNEEPIEALGDVNGVRDIYDIFLIKLAAERNMPLFGICRGEQLINVAFGGSLYQDIPSQHPDTTINHNQSEPSNYPTHTITLLPGSTIASIAQVAELSTNSHHHQAVKQIAPGFKVTAQTSDGIPEAIEATNDCPIWGVQFHPEGQAIQGDSIMVRFFEFITEQALLYHYQKEHP